MLRSLAACAALVVAGAALAVPGALRLGEHRIEVASCGVRSTLWIEHYIAALYLPGRGAPLQELRSPASAKALYVQIVSDRHLPASIPREWGEPIARHLGGADLARAHEAYRALRPGDELIIAYKPGAGVFLLVNDQVMAAAADHSLIEAVLETWANGEPLAEKLSRLMDRNRCAG